MNVLLERVEGASYNTTARSPIVTNVLAVPGALLGANGAAVAGVAVTGVSAVDVGTVDGTSGVAFAAAGAVEGAVEGAGAGVVAGAGVAGAPVERSTTGACA